LHCVLGLASELEEWENASFNNNHKEELGDFSWYGSEGVSACGFKLSSIVEEALHNLRDGKIDTLIESVGNLCDLVKSETIRGKEVTNEQYFVGFVRLYGSVIMECEQNNLIFLEMLQANNRKLTKVRHKQGYTEESSQNRDLEAEAKALS
jgi:hypothetical protein